MSDAGKPYFFPDFGSDEQLRVPIIKSAVVIKSSQPKRANQSFFYDNKTPKKTALFASTMISLMK
jgi:hypothetical protein